MIAMMNDYDYGLIDYLHLKSSVSQLELTVLNGLGLRSDGKH